MGDFFDEVSVINKKRLEGGYYGILNFLTRATFFVQFLVFWIVHELTGFDPEATTQTPLAQLGIMLHLSLIPAIIMLFGAFFFFVFFKLTPDKMQTVRAQLEELGI
jgi:Na+/melibiose symporter-like transporter